MLTIHMTVRTNASSSFGQKNTVEPQKHRLSRRSRRARATVSGPRSRHPPHPPTYAGSVTALRFGRAAANLAATNTTTAPSARTAAFFDLDKTIIAKSSTLAFSKPFFNQGLLNRRAVLKSSYAQFIFLLSGADHDQMDRMRAHLTNMCTGWDVEQVKSIVNETLHDIVTPLVFAEAADLIAAHKLCGRDVVVVSASGEEIVAPIARALGATHAMATRMVVEDGRYTGEIAFYCYGEGKVQAIRELAAREGYPLEHCYAYSDSITDLPMLEAVGHPSVVNPDRGLAQRSHRTRLARVVVFPPGVAARPHPGAVGCRDRDHRRGGRQRAGRRRGHLFAVAPLRVLGPGTAFSARSKHKLVRIPASLRNFHSNWALLC